MKTTKTSCSHCQGGVVPVLHDLDKLHVEVCKVVETTTVGTSRYVLAVTNPLSTLFWTDDEGRPITEDGLVIVWSA